MTKNMASALITAAVIAAQGMAQPPAAAASDFSASQKQFDGLCAGCHGEGGQGSETVRHHGTHGDTELVASLWVLLECGQATATAREIAAQVGDLCHKTGSLISCGTGLRPVLPRHRLRSR